MCKFLLLLFGLFLAETVRYAVSMQSPQLLSVAVGEFDGITRSDFIRHRTKGMVADCQLLCLKDEQCMSFFYNHISGICQIHGVVFFNSSDGQVCPGSQYYRQVQEVCPSQLGYIYNRALDFCYKFHYLDPSSPGRASVVCQYEGGNLIVLDTKEKYDHIGWTIKASTFPSKNIWSGFLIGAEQRNDTGDRTWEWHDGRRVDETIWNWCPGQPRDEDWLFTAMVASAHHPSACVNDVHIDPKRFVCELQI